MATTAASSRSTSPTARPSRSAGSADAWRPVARWPCSATTGATMPRWMRTMATLNPVSHATEALRGNVLGTATVADSDVALAAAASLWALVTLVPSERR
jgi:hypothetical protein